MLYLEEKNQKSKPHILLISEIINKYPLMLPYVQNCKHISEMYDMNIFVWDDTTIEMENEYKNLLNEKTYYKYPTEKTKRPFIPLTQKELNYILSSKGQKEIKIVYYYSTIESLLKSRKFTTAKLLLSKLGKFIKTDYSEFTHEDCPNCILLKLFKIEENNERSFKNTTKKQGINTIMEG